MHCASQPAVISTQAYGHGHSRASMRDNNEMKQTKPAMARMARSSLLIVVLHGGEAPHLARDGLPAHGVNATKVAGRAANFPPDSRAATTACQRGPRPLASRIAKAMDTRAKA